MYKIGCTDFYPRKRFNYRRVNLLRSYLAFDREERLRFSPISNKILFFPLFRRCKGEGVSLVVLLTSVPGCVLRISFLRLLGFGSATRPEKSYLNRDFQYLILIYMKDLVEFLTL
jgi:hypothetical protein